MFTFIWLTTSWSEYTIEVSLPEIGKKANGPFFVKIWKAVLFTILSCEIIVVYAWLLYFLIIFLLKYRFEISFEESQLTTSSYFSKKDKFFSLKNSKNLEKITRTFFMHRRKMIKKPYYQLFNNDSTIASKVGIDLNLRPQNLDFDTYYKLTIEYEKLRS